ERRGGRIARHPPREGEYRQRREAEEDEAVKRQSGDRREPEPNHGRDRDRCEVVIREWVAGEARMRRREVVSVDERGDVPQVLRPIPPDVRMPGAQAVLIDREGPREQQG